MEPVAEAKIGAQVELRERRVAQILRDLMEAYEFSAQVGASLRAGNLDFEPVRALVGESEESALYRLKEECHALFRLDQESSETELQAEELFDLAVGALYHEAMKFREGFYLTTNYGPRLERMMREGARGPLAEAFRSVIEAGRQRVLESGVEMAELFNETRDQLLILLRQLPRSGAVARSLVENLDRTEKVFRVRVGDLLEGLYGSAAEGYRRAVENLLEYGHYTEARELLEQYAHAGAAPELPDGGHVLRFATGMESFFAGDPGAALERLERWIGDGAQGPDSWRAQARKVLEMIRDDGAHADLAAQAGALLERIKPSGPAT